MNNKGFSLVELLAVIAILGILFGIGIQAYSIYKNKAKQQGYDTMAKSASQAAEDYLMDHPAARSIEFQKLFEEGYLSTLKDPGNRGSECTGKVNVATKRASSDRELDENVYAVYECCTNYYYYYTFPGGDKIKMGEACTAESFDRIVTISTEGKTVDTLETCDDVSIGTEKFKVVSTTEDTITVLPYENITLTDLPVQSATAGTTAFSTSRYWPYPEKPIDMSDPRNKVQKYIDNYKKTLELMGLKNISTRIAYRFTDNGNCQNPSQRKGYWTCSPNPPDYNQGLIIAVSKTGGRTYPFYSNTSGFGVRPVVTFSKSNIE